MKDSNFNCFHCKDTGWNLDSQYAEFCVHCDYDSFKENEALNNYRKELAKVCKLSGIQMCIGCGLTPQGLDSLIDQELQKVREEYQPINIQGLHSKSGKLYALVELPAQDSQLFIRPLKQPKLNQPNN